MYTLEEAYDIARKSSNSSGDLVSSVDTLLYFAFMFESQSPIRKVEKKSPFDSTVFGGTYIRVHKEMGWVDTVPANYETLLSMSAYDELKTIPNSMAHYGIKGMRWGIRKDDSVTGPRYYVNSDQTMSYYSPPSSVRYFSRINGSHSIEDDLSAVNPEWADESMRTGNCASCVMAYELRRRGYDVDARDYAYGPDHEAMEAYFAGGGAYFENIDPPTEEATLENLSDMPDGARGFITIKFGDLNAGHVFSWEVEGGKVRFIDPQSGKTDASDQLRDTSEIQILRTDNAPIARTGLVGVESHNKKDVLEPMSDKEVLDDYIRVRDESK